MSEPQSRDTKGFGKLKTAAVKRLGGVSTLGLTLALLLNSSRGDARYTTAGTSPWKGGCLRPLPSSSPDNRQWRLRSPNSEHRSQGRCDHLRTGWPTSRSTTTIPLHSDGCRDYSTRIPDLYASAAILLPLHDAVDVSTEQRAS